MSARADVHSFIIEYSQALGNGSSFRPTADVKQFLLNFVLFILVYGVSVRLSSSDPALSKNAEMG